MTAWRSAVALVPVLVAVQAAACGGGPGGTATPTPDYPGLAVLRLDLFDAPDAEGAINETIEVLEARLAAEDIEAAVSFVEPDELNVRYVEGVDDTHLTRLLTASTLRFMAPVHDELGRTECSSPQGSFYVQPDALITAFDSDGRLFVSCVAEGKQGQVTWTPAIGKGADGVEKELTPELFDSVSKAEDPYEGPILEVVFTDDGARVFEDVTRHLVGLPLGIFLDDELLRAPIVGIPVSIGQMVITARSPDDIALLQTVIRFGPLPVPVEIVSIGAR